MYNIKMVFKNKNPAERFRLPGFFHQRTL